MTRISKVVPIKSSKLTYASSLAVVIVPVSTTDRTIDSIRVISSISNRDQQKLWARR